MVNGRLKFAVRARTDHLCGPDGICDRVERNFATNAALTSKIAGIGIARSRFGPADSWVIKIAGTAAFAVGH
jgi:hypothetical protein